MLPAHLLNMVLEVIIDWHFKKAAYPPIVSIGQTKIASIYIGKPTIPVLLNSGAFVKNNVIDQLDHNNGSS